MNPKIENQRMLARLVGIDEEEAAKRLEKVIKVSCSAAAQPLAEELTLQLERTVSIAENDEPFDLEVVIDCQPSSEGQCIFVAGTADTLVISSNKLASSGGVFAALPRIFRSIAASYVCSVALKHVLGVSELSAELDPFKVEYAKLGLDRALLETSIKMDDTVLAGAGAIGNGFLRALNSFNVSGTMTVADPKRVTEGNLNRCLYFTSDDVNQSKALVLCKRAQPDLPNLALQPFEGTSGELVKKLGRVRRVIVGVDSRRARRSIQNDLHVEVIDASTTEATEIIVHSHRQLTSDACLSCVYKHVPQEFERERDIASALGIDLADVTGGFITTEVAQRIAQRHPKLDSNEIVGVAYDTLFKQLCAEQTIQTASGGQTLAPFAFVSTLAGSLLAIELARSFAGDIGETNYMCVSPWHPPHSRLRRVRPREPGCEFCSKPGSITVLKEVWRDELS